MLLSVDIGVFIGARSDVNQSEWFWNNDTRITNSAYPTSNTSTCQQMPWPLTYDNGINLHRKFCHNEAYFVCQSKCTSGFKIKKLHFLRNLFSRSAHCICIKSCSAPLPEKVLNFVIYFAR